MTDNFQVFGGCNADSDSWDVCNNIIAYSCGPCVLIQDIYKYDTFRFFPLKRGIVTSVKFFNGIYIVAGTCDGFVLLINIIESSVITEIKYESSITHLSLFNNYVLLCTALDGVKALSIENDTLIESTFETKLPNVRCSSLAVYRCFNSIITAYGYPNGSVHIRIPEKDSEIILNFGKAWVRAISFATEPDGSLLMATASQDNICKVWRISPHCSKDLEEYGVTIRGDSVLNTNDGEVNVVLHSDLIRHSDWVNCIHFYDNKNLCTCSFDGLLFVWSLDENDEFDVVDRLGASLVEDDQSGFISCKLIAPNEVIVSARNGGISHFINGECVRCFGGHFDVVNSVCWSENDDFFISVGDDKVARVFGQNQGIYSELARPIIHGHTIFDVQQVNRTDFAFCSDEKIIRVLQMTSNFTKILDGNACEITGLPIGSFVPPLQLSNKIIRNSGDIDNDLGIRINAKDFEFESVPPAHLLWLTRWPEIKIYQGHFREITRLALPKDKSYIASGDDKGAVVVNDELERRFNSKKCGNSCACSNDPVLALAVSPDGNSILSVTRDGEVRVFDCRTGAVLMTATVREDNTQDVAYESSLGASYDKSGDYVFVTSIHGVHAIDIEGKIKGKFEHNNCTAIELIDNREFYVGDGEGGIFHIEYDASEMKFIEKNTSIQSHARRVTRIKVKDNSGKVFVSSSADYTVILHRL